MQRQLAEVRAGGGAAESRVLGALPARRHAVLRAASRLCGGGGRDPSIDARAGGAVLSRRPLTRRPNAAHAAAGFAGDGGAARGPAPLRRREGVARRTDRRAQARGGAGGREHAHGKCHRPSLPLAVRDGRGGRAGRCRTSCGSCRRSWRRTRRRRCSSCSSRQLSLSAPPPTAAVDAQAAAVNALLSTRITRTREQTTAPARRRAPLRRSPPRTRRWLVRRALSQRRTVPHRLALCRCRPVSRCGAAGVVRSQGTLKSEIVQLERAHKRDSVDMEYLKNVVLKYTTLSPVETAGSEPEREFILSGYSA